MTLQMNQINNGMQQNVYSNDDEEEKKQIGNEESNIIPINKHRGR